MPHLFVHATRWERWVENFTTRHGAATYVVADGALRGTAADGSTFEARLPFGRAYAGAAAPAALSTAATPPVDWGVLLVRKGGFAVARLTGATTTASKVGRRHVQGRTKAGGQSQQRFARRRDNQAREAYLAAAGHAGTLLAGVPVLVIGGDREALRTVLDETGLGAAVAATLPEVHQPRRGALEDGVQDALSLALRVHNADDGPPRR